jgi:PKD repeat protein
MKKLLFLWTILPALSFAQLQEVNANIEFQASTPSYQTSVSETKSASCGPDTVEYTIAKATGLQALNLNNASSATGVSQYFNCPQPITISGMQFYAYKLDATGGASLNATVSIYTAGSDSMPSGAPLATGTVAIDTSFGGGSLAVLSKTANFPPTTVSAPYVLVVENNSPNGIGFVFNSWTAADGAQEWLVSANLGGVWTRGYDVNVGGPLLDADAIINPFVTYVVDAGFSASANCFTGGPTITFTNTSSPILQDRMYNQAAYLGLTSLSYAWDFGDGGGGYAIDTSNTYANTTLDYMVYLADTMYGWSSQCVDLDSTFIGNDLNPDWTSTPVGGGTVNFTDNSTSSSAITAWLWDFGDGNVSTQQNPSHTYAASGNYTVCLTAVTACGTDSSCAIVQVTVCNNPTAAFTETNNDPSFDFVDGSTTTGVVTYAWDFGDGNTSTMQNPSHTYTDNGTYTVLLTVTDDCGTDTVSTTVTVTNGCVDPVASFTQTGTEPTFTFTNTSTSSTNTTYSWDMGDGNTYSTADVNHTYTANNSYTVILIVTDDCGADTTTQTVTVATIGLLEQDLGNVVVYPNPANTMVQIQSSQLITNVQLIDMSGRLVLSMPCDANFVELKTEQMAEGQYTVRLEHQNGDVVVQLIEVIH